MGLDISLFVLALSFASSYGVLPLFVRHLSDSNLAVGAIPSLRAATLLTPIFVAGLTERLRRKQPFILGVTVFERVPYLVLAIATPLLALTHPSTLLWIFYAMLALTTLSAGIAMPAWLDMIARMIPADWRGRFFGLSSALGGLLGVAGSAGAAFLLGRFDWVIGIALCFAIAFVFLVLSFICLAYAREPTRSDRGHGAAQGYRLAATPHRPAAGPKPATLPGGAAADHRRQPDRRLLHRRCQRRAGAERWDSRALRDRSARRLDRRESDLGLCRRSHRPQAGHCRRGALHRARPAPGAARPRPAVGAARLRGRLPPRRAGDERPIADGADLHHRPRTG